MFKNSIIAAAIATTTITAFAPIANAESNVRRDHRNDTPTEVVRDHRSETAGREAQNPNAKRRGGQNEVVVARRGTAPATGITIPDRVIKPLRLNCNVGVRKLQSMGYDSVLPVDCKGKTYNYSAMVDASLFRASMNAYTGVVNVTFIGLVR